MGNARFLSCNLITDVAQLTVSSERPGPVGLAVKTGTGSATVLLSGPYTGTDPRQYVIQVYDVTAGKEIGQALWRWRRSDDAAWRASGIVTSAVTPVTMEYGLSLLWQGGSGDDFVVNDQWTVIVDKPFGKRLLLDRDRDSEWRSADVAGAITFDLDLGTPQQLDVVAMLDHNLSSAAALSLLGDAVHAWGAPAVSEAITRQPSNVLRYLTTASRTDRYWRLSVTDTGNPDGYVRMSELYLGTYSEFTANFSRGWKRSKRAMLFGPTSGGRRARGVWANDEVITLQYELMTAADRALMEALFAATYDPAAGVVRPFLLNFDSADPADVSLYEWETPETGLTSPYLGWFAWPHVLVQLPRTARSGQ